MLLPNFNIFKKAENNCQVCNKYVTIEESVILLWENFFSLLKDRRNEGMKNGFLSKYTFVDMNEMKVYFFVWLDTELHAKHQKVTGLIFIDIMKSKH